MECLIWRLAGEQSAANAGRLPSDSSADQPCRIHERQNFVKFFPKSTGKLLTLGKGLR